MPDKNIRERVGVLSMKSILYTDRSVLAQREGVFNPHVDITDTQWKSLITRYHSKFQHGFSGPLFNEFLSSFTPFLVFSFAPEHIKKEFFTQERVDDLKIVAHALEDIDQSMGFDNPLPQFAAIMKFCFPEFPNTISGRQKISAKEYILLDTESRGVHYHQTVLNRFFMGVIDPESKLGVEGDTSYWGPLLDHHIRAVKEDVSLTVNDVVILATAKLLGKQVTRIDTTFKDRWHMFEQKVQDVEKSDPTRLPLVLFGIAVLSAEKVEVSEKGITFVYPREKSPEDVKERPPVRRFR